MTLRLPPKHVVFPSNAVFRKYPPPPDLWETWKLIRAIAWVNRYEFTPPASLSELLALHHNLQTRALEYRLQRLAATGWLTVQRTSGRANVYIPTVPDDKPIDYSTETAVHGGEPASVIRHEDGEDSARHVPMVKSAGQTATPATGCSGLNSTVVVSDQSFNHREELKQQQNISTSAPPRNGSAPAEILELLDRTPVVEPGRSAVACLSHMTRNYVLPWVHYAEDRAEQWDKKGFNGGGWLFLRFKAGEPAPKPYRDNAERRERNGGNVWWGAEHDSSSDRLNSDSDSYLNESGDALADEHNALVRQTLAERAEQQSRYYRDGTADTWHATLGELQLQMTKGTFDAWVRGARVLGWENESKQVLVVGVKNQYAKEWLENRLHTTMTRTVTGIVGHAVEVRYEVIR